MLRVAPWLLLLLLLLAAPAARADTWQRPVDGPLLRAYDVGGDPYARGWHRGVDLAAARGSPVRSACAGRVSFAGRVPRGGRTVSVRCGALVATLQQLGSLAVRAGAVVARGTRVGTVGASSDPRQRRPHVHLGARDLASGRYLDPLDLLGAGAPARPLVPPAGRPPPRAVPLGPAPGSPRATPVRPAPVTPRTAPVRRVPDAPHAAPARPVPVSPRTAPVRPVPAAPWSAPLRRGPVPAVPGAAPLRPGPVPAAPRAAPLRPGPVRAAPEAAPEPAGPAGRGADVPWLVWIGLACVGLGLPIGGLVRFRRRRSAASRVARIA